MMWIGIVYIAITLWFWGFATATDNRKRAWWIRLIAAAVWPAAIVIAIYRWSGRPL